MFENTKVNPLVVNQDFEYDELESSLKYPNNPAYFRINKFF